MYELGVVYRNIRRADSDVTRTVQTPAVGEVTNVSSWRSANADDARWTPVGSIRLSE